jgi:hypothetical protein
VGTNRARLPFRPYCPRLSLHVVLSGSCLDRSVYGLHFNTQQLAALCGYGVSTVAVNEGHVEEPRGAQANVVRLMKSRKR